MPNIVTEVAQKITQTGSGTCFALPGQNATGTHCDVNLTAHVGVDTAHDIWVWFEGEFTNGWILQEIGRASCRERV